MDTIVIKKQGLVTTLATEDLEMLLILANAEVTKNPPTDCSFNWQEAISKALIEIQKK